MCHFYLKTGPDFGTVGLKSADFFCLSDPLWEITLLLISTFAIIFRHRPNGLCTKKIIAIVIKVGRFQWNHFTTFSFVPRPSARTKYFLSWTKLKLSKSKFFSRVKNYIFCFQKSCKMNISC